MQSKEETDPLDRPTTPSSSSMDKNVVRDTSDNEDSEVDDYNLTEDQKRALAELDNLKNELGYTGRSQACLNVHSQVCLEMTDHALYRLLQVSNYFFFFNKIKNCEFDDVFSEKSSISLWFFVCSTTGIVF